MESTTFVYFFMPIPNWGDQYWALHLSGSSRKDALMGNFFYTLGAIGLRASTILSFGLHVCPLYL